MLKQITTILISMMSLMTVAYAQQDERPQTPPSFADVTGEAPAMRAEDVPKQKIEDKAFEILMEKYFPLGVENKRKLRDATRDHENVKYETIDDIESLTDIIQVSTKPGARPVEIYLVPENASTVTIIDQTGQPWPITSVIHSNSNNFLVDRITGHEYDNIFRLDSKRTVGTTSLNIALVGLPVPITVRMINNKKRFHPTPILQIDKPGPEAKVMPVMSMGPVNQDEVLKNIVLGIAQQGFEPMQTNDSNVEAWRFKGHLYIRTSYLPTSPSPISIHYGPGGYAAYKLREMPKMVMLTSNGEQRNITITERQ